MVERITACSELSRKRYLAHEFRLTSTTDRAIAWLAGDDNTWKAKIGVLIEFAKGRGHDARTMRADYDLLSELALPHEAQQRTHLRSAW